MHKLFEGLILGACAMLAGLPTAATAGGDVSCELSFQMSGWSVFYKESSGSGTIKCSNGQSMAVKLRARGGGLTFGKSTIDANSPDCTGYGVMVTFDPYTVTEWRYTGPQTLRADLLAPALQDRRVTSYWLRDNQLGTSKRENCHGGMGVDPQSGGFTMIGRYQAFGPGEAGGSFYYDTCGSTSK